VPETPKVVSRAVPMTATSNATTGVDGPARPEALGSLRGALDFLSDWAVLCFASWTLFAYLGMITDARVSLLVPVWLATTPFLAAFLIIRGVRRGPAADVAATAGPAEPEGWTARRTLLVIGLAAGFVAALLAASRREIPWPVVWLPVFVAAAAAVGAGRLRSRAPTVVTEERNWPADLFAALVSLGFAGMSLIIMRANSDDVFYVNRATATSQLNRIPTLDVIFTHEEAARGGGAGLPVDSYSALQGGLARLFDVHALSVAYFLFPVVFTFLATWAMWRLVRAWAPSHAWLCFALGCVFWLFSSQFALTSGNYFLNRMWQGKVPLVAWLVPTAYVYLTRWLGKRDAVTAVLILAAALCSIGLTSSATFVAPLVFLTAVIPLVARKDWRALALPLVAAAIPLVIGLFVLSRFPLSETVGLGVLFPQSWFYQQVVGVGLVATVAALALWAAPWLARSGPAQQVTTGLAVVVAVVIAPGMLELLSDISGLTATLRRTLWIVPFPALVALLAVLPLRRTIGRLDARIGRFAPFAAALTIGVLLVAFGAPLWTDFRTGKAWWHYPPTWKMHKAAEARAILRKYDGDGPILARRDVMQAIVLLAVEPKAVNARTLYLERTDLPPEAITDRIVLTEFIHRENPPPSSFAVRKALARLEVGLICVPVYARELVPTIEALGPFEPAFDTRGQVCLERAAAST
jgi:Family of unknown function (DUF6077)